MTSFSGSDVAQLRSLAARFESQAGKMREIVTSSSWALATAAWTGAEVDQLRAKWNGASKPHLLRVAAELSETAVTLRRQAAEQERVSNATTGRTDSGSRGGLREPVAESPRNMRGLVGNVKDQHKSGSQLHIQEIVGSDGKTRLVVNIGGTQGNWEGLGGWGENWDLYTRGDSPVVKAIRAQLDEQLKDYPGAEVMLVGYSQGGMVAQALAASGDYNVTEVVTVGSPRFDDVDYGGAHVTRLEHNADPVVNITEGVDGSIFEDAGRGFRNFLDGRSVENPPVDFRAGNLFENAPPWNPIAGFIQDTAEGNNVHDVGTGDYDWVADQFLTSNDPRHVAARERIENFLDGAVVRNDDLHL